jgi:hypothetical protein
MATEDRAENAEADEPQDGVLVAVAVVVGDGCECERCVSGAESRRESSAVGRA